MKTVDKNKWFHHRLRAESFLDGMLLLADDIRSYKHAVALLAVHASISLADAVLVAFAGARSNEQDHRSVQEMLRKLCGTMKVSPEGIGHLGWLLGKKTYFAYADSRVLEVDARIARVKAERFKAWVNRNFPEVLAVRQDYDAS